MCLAVCVFFVHTHNSRTQPWRALWIVRWTTRAVVAAWARRKRGRPGGARYWNEDRIAWPSLLGKSSPFLRPHLLRNHETFRHQLERATLASSPFRAQSPDLLVSGSIFFFCWISDFWKIADRNVRFFKEYVELDSWPVYFLQSWDGIACRREPPRNHTASAVNLNFGPNQLQMIVCNICL
jgi:hypothetical protein